MLETTPMTHDARRNEIRASSKKVSSHLAVIVIRSFSRNSKPATTKKETVQTAAKRVESATVEHNRDKTAFFFLLLLIFLLCTISRRDTVLVRH